MGVFIDLTGARFGRLVVLAQMARRVNKRIMWECICDCGNLVFVSGNNLRTGNTVSCSCIKATNHLKHGMSNTPEDRAYHAAKGRCNNPDNEAYLDYGGRGVTFCFTSFEEFYADVGPRPEGTDNKGKSLWSLNRIDNNGNYEPGNVEWTDRSTQMSNRRPFKLPFRGFSSLVDIRFTRLVVTGQVEKGDRRHWLCACDCGSTIVVRENNLKLGNTKSCGCLKKRSP